MMQQQGDYNAALYAPPSAHAWSDAAASAWSDAAQHTRPPAWKAAPLPAAAHHSLQLQQQPSSQFHAEQEPAGSLAAQQLGWRRESISNTTAAPVPGHNRHGYTSVVTKTPISPSGYSVPAAQHPQHMMHHGHSSSSSSRSNSRVMSAAPPPPPAAPASAAAAALAALAGGDSRVSSAPGQGGYAAPPSAAAAAAPSVPGDRSSMLVWNVGEREPSPQHQQQQQSPVAGRRAALPGSGSGYTPSSQQQQLSSSSGSSSRASSSGGSRPSSQGPKAASLGLLKLKQLSTARFTQGLSAAARATTAALAAGAEAEFVQLIRHPCPSCGRCFAPAALQQHAAICDKVFGQKRKAFNSKACRLQGTEALQHQQDTSSNGGRKQHNLDSRPAASSEQRNKAKWKAQSEQLRAAMRGSQLQAAGSSWGVYGAYEAATSSAAPGDDRVPCLHCGRRFAALVAERHVPKCAEAQARPNRLAAGGGKGAYMRSGKS